MGVDYENVNRNYLFGRLLAVADVLERQTYEHNENRTTNARRYWNTFSKRPAATWKIIHEKLEPYFEKHRKPAQIVYNKLMEEICGKFTAATFTNEPLNEWYLLGYYNQSESLRYVPDKTKDEESVDGGVVVE